MFRRRAVSGAPAQRHVLQAEVGEGWIGPLSIFTPTKNLARSRCGFSYRRSWILELKVNSAVRLIAPLAEQGKKMVLTMMPGSTYL